MIRFHAFFLFLLVFSSCLPAYAQYQFRSDAGSQPLDENTQVSLLQAPLGSRFSLSWVAGEQAMHTGALGYDSDQMSELLIMVEAEGKKECFRTSTLPQGGQYLQNQSWSMNFSTLHLAGQHSAGIKVQADIITPFTPSETLQDTAALKIQIAPLHYLVVSLKAENSLTAIVQVGFREIPYDPDRKVALASWRRTRQGPVYYRDAADLPTKRALKGVKRPYWARQEGAFFGLGDTLALRGGQTKKMELAYAAHHAGEVLHDRRTDRPMTYYYNRFWQNIGQVLQYATDNYRKNLRATQAFNKLALKKTAPGALSQEEIWTACLTFRTDLANTILVQDYQGAPGFYVIEGRFRHMNTIDVAHETELMAVFCPWRLKLQIDNWMDYMATRELVVERYSPFKKSHFQAREAFSSAAYGPFLYHDVGDYPHVSKQTDYDFGPHMAIEENSNIALLLYWYWKLSGDDAFVQNQLGQLEILLHSMVNRDTDGSGLADEAVGWATYDVSEALKRSPENVYLGVKQLAAYVVAAEMFEELAVSEDNDGAVIDTEAGNTDGATARDKFRAMSFDNTALRKKQARRYRQEAKKIASTLQKAFDKHGYLPVSLEKDFEGWDQHCLVLAEGLFYPGLCGTESPILSQIKKPLKATYQSALKKNKTGYGIKLSSEEGVTWFSKVMVSDIVARKWFGMADQSTARYTYEWNKNNPQAYNDGAYNSTRPWVGNWYPRGVSSLGYLYSAYDFRPSERAAFLNRFRE